MAVVDVEFRANANFSGLISQANMANAAISRLQGSVTSLNAEQISQAFAEFSKGLTGSGQYIAQTVRVSDATQRFGQDLVNNKLQLKDYAREFGRYVSGRESQIKKLADQQVRMQQSLVVSRGMDPSGRLIAQVFTPTGLTNDLETNTMRATARLQVMNEFLHKASTSVINWGKNTQWAGRQMTVGLTVPLSMLATATGKAFYELDTQLIQMQKVYGTGIKGVGDEAIASIRSQVMDLSRELAKAYGIPVAQTAALAADIAQAGKTGQDLLSSVEQTTKLATLGEIDRQDAMKATLSIQSTFNQNTKELSDSINFLNAVENATNVSLQDLVTGIPKAGPVVKALGGDIKDLSLMMVAMKEGGIPASEAANAIKSSLASLINPTQKVTDKMKTFGIDLVSIVDKNAGQLMPTLVEFRDEINKLDELSRQRILEELFGKFQFARVNALFNNLGRAGSQTIQVMELMGLSTAELAGIADKELKTMAESASGRFKRLFATVQGDLAVAGEGILNAGSTILSVISKIINAFEKFPDGLKKFLGGTALLAAVIGPIIMTIGVLGNFFGYIMKGLALMRTFGRRGASDFQLMTAETIATANAGDMLENKLFDQAKAADLMRTSIEKLTASLVEVGAVSSTAGRAIDGVMTNAQGRAASAGTAMEAMHIIPSINTQDSRGKSVTAESPIAKIYGSKDLNQNTGGSGQMRTAAIDIADPEFARSIAVGSAFNKEFKEMGRRLELSNEELKEIAKVFNDSTLTYEQKVERFGQIAKADNPGVVLADFVERSTKAAEKNLKDITAYSRMGEDALKARMEDTRTRLISAVKETEKYKSASDADKKKIEAQVEERLGRIINDPQRREIGGRMETDEELKARTPSLATRAYTLDTIEIQPDTRRAVPGFSGQGGGGDVNALGSQVAADIGFGGLGIEPDTAQQQDFMDSLGDATLAMDDDREYITQLSNERKELGKQIAEATAIERKAQAEDEKFFEDKKSERSKLKRKNKAEEEITPATRKLLQDEEAEIAKIRKRRKIDDDEKNKLIEAVKKRRTAEMQAAAEVIEHNKEVERSRAVIDKETADRTVAAKQRKDASDEQIDALKDDARAIRADEKSRVAGARRRRTAASPTPTAAGSGDSSSSLIVAPVGGPGGDSGDDADEKGRKQRKRAALGGAAGTAAMLGSTMLPSGPMQNIAMMASSATMFAPALMAFKKEADPNKVSKFGDSISKLTSKFAFLGTALRAIGPALVSPIGLIIIAIAAIGATAFAVFKNLEKGFSQSQSWMDSSKESAEALGYKYQEINFTTQELTGSTDKAKSSVEALSEAIQNAPENNPLKKMSEDFKNDASSADTVQKAVGFFQLQIARGVDESKAREQLAAVLTNAGKSVLIPQVNVEIGKINTSDKGANLAGALSQGLTTAKKQGWQEFSQTLQVGVQAGITGVAKYVDVMTGWTNLTSGAMKTLAGDVQTANNAFDEKAMTNLATSFGQVVQEQAKLDPTKWQEFVASLANNPALQSILASSTGLQQLSQSFLEATGNADDPAWKAAAASIKDVGDLANLSAINLYKIVPAATAAGRAAQVAMVQAANAATAAAEAAAVKFAASLVKKPSTGGGRGGKTADPYDGQKKANQKRIDQEKEIIKAIEKKRDAERKAFEEKKKQDEYLKKQADLQIGYREALATGDFAAAALVKNEMLAEQARKRAEDAQKKKDDAYQADIDARQGNVGKLEDVSKKLDALSQKAKETSASTSQAANDQYNTNVTTATTTMETLIDKQKEHNYTSVAAFKADNPKLVKQLEEIGVDVDKFFTTAYKVGTQNIQENIGSLKGVNEDVKASLIKLLLSVNDIASLGGWIRDQTEAGKPPSNEQILAKATEIKRLRVLDAKIKAAAKEDEKKDYTRPPGTSLSNPRPGSPNYKDPADTDASHAGGPIGPGMVSNRLGKSIRSPIANDERFILAQDGEYMISAAAAGIIGRKNLDAINNGKLPVAAVGGNSGSNYNFTVNAAPGQDAKQIAQEVQRIFQINERRKGGSRT